MPLARLLLWLISLTSLGWCALSWPNARPGSLELGVVLTVLVLYATYGVLWPQCGMYGVALAKGKAGNRHVALTFDDGPHPVTTRVVLSILREYDARATFFVLGHKVEAYPEIVREIHEAGHTLGIHGYQHDRLFSFRSPRYAWRQVERTRQAIARACGATPNLFRPPVGFASYRTFRGAERAAVRIIAWSVRSLDGVRSANPQRVARRVIERLEDGAIVLLHDAAERDDFTPASIAALPQILRALRERKLTAVGVEQL